MKARSPSPQHTLSLSLSLLKKKKQVSLEGPAASFHTKFWFFYNHPPSTKCSGDRFFFFLNIRLPNKKINNHHDVLYIRQREYSTASRGTYWEFSCAGQWHIWLDSCWLRSKRKPSTNVKSKPSYINIYIYIYTGMWCGLVFCICFFFHALVSLTSSINKKRTKEREWERQ